MPPVAYLCQTLLLASTLFTTWSSQGPVFRESSHVRRAYGAAGTDQTFDYVVVGGGTAGLTIASRLAENPSLSVAVIEAGGFYEDAGNTSIVPGYDSVYAGTDPSATNPLVDWGFLTTPQKVRIYSPMRENKS